MDDIRDDFEDKMEEDEVEALDKEDVLLGIGDEEDAEDDEDQEKLLGKFGFTVDDEEPLTDF